MKKLFVLVLFSINTPAMALTGDTKLACEAVLCLSSSARPSECSPSLDKYFGINKKSLSDTINARINFLNLCPVSNQANMPSLINAIAHGAGRCDADYLNRFNRETYYKKVCKKDNFYSDSTCKTEKISIISDTKPYYCTAYEHHQFTDLNTKYLGDKFNNGKWYDSKDYEKALNEIQKQEINIKNNRDNVTYTSERDYNNSQRDSR